MLALIGNLGPFETVLIAIVVILVFGGRLPEVARQVMRMMARVRGALDEIKRDVDFDGELRKINTDIRRQDAQPTPPPVTIDQGPDPTPEAEAADAPDEKSESDK